MPNTTQPIIFPNVDFSGLHYRDLLKVRDTLGALEVIIVHYIATNAYTGHSEGQQIFICNHTSCQQLTNAISSALSLDIANAEAIAQYAIAQYGVDAWVALANSMEPDIGKFESGLKQLYGRYNLVKEGPYETHPGTRAACEYRLRWVKKMRDDVVNRLNADAEYKALGFK